MVDREERVMGKRDIIDSAIMIARATQSFTRQPTLSLLEMKMSKKVDKLTIQPLAPSVVDETGPGAHPRCLEIGERTAQPTNIPAAIDRVTGRPMMMPLDQLTVRPSS